MTYLYPDFPLLGTRPYVHSTSILNFLDGIVARSEDNRIDLRIVSQVLPGARALLLDHADTAAVTTTPAAAIARIGARSLLFVNPSAPVAAERRPDGFEEMLSALTQANGETTLGLPSNNRHTFWDRTVFGAKCHLTRYHCATSLDASPQGAARFLLSRIVCKQAHDAETLNFATEIVLDGKWVRIGIHAKGQRLGYALAGQ
ncbi:MAG: hypothetical protein A3D16_00685 [Rhodobacterales bacterium RIFCSPHIGHO2_02_FULL_62_130]|nr:MAG: hypothetical protein A3D16_00685 [Rhodobacterales bacterium RIFCSPHIGHO2_02_FULL_62_130]OHC54985.1 MAG: hypothetical protein A3E48_10330 [Rhodobacterales bacterium RIFCSPHIGHO2_12_FULL_62_75]HCY99568.1 hypothetical protein [Rhodobacter sp.]